MYKGHVIHSVWCQDWHRNMPIPSFSDADARTSSEVFHLLCDRIRYERTRKGLSQVKFAGLCGIPVRTYKRFELYQCDSIDVLIRIAQGFGRASGLETLFPAQPLGLRGMDALLDGLKKKIDARVVVGEAILDNSGNWGKSSK